MTPRAAYIRNETLLSMAINTVLSIAFVFLAFGGHPLVPVTGLHGIIVDMAPQAFMITLMSILVPSLVTARRVRTGVTTHFAHVTTSTTSSVWLTAVATALLAALVVTGVCDVLLPTLLPPSVRFLPLLVSKAIFGAALAAAVTPWAIRRVLR